MTEQKHTPRHELWRWQATTAFLFVLFVILSAYTTYHHQAASATNPYPLIDPARQFIDQENFIINIQPLREDLMTMTDEAGQEGIGMSVYFEYLNTGANINTNRELRVWPASLIKVPMAMVAMKKVEDNEWSLGQKFTLTEEDRLDQTYGTLWQRPAGTEFELDELLRHMLAESDNTAYIMVRRNVTESDLQSILDELGLDDLFDGEGLMTSKEYARIFRSLFTSSYLEPADSQKLLALMQKSSFKEYLAQSVPETVPFAHKFGIDLEKHAYLDAGIAYVQDRPYMLVVVMQGTGAKDEQLLVRSYMHRASKATYDYISAYEH